MYALDARQARSLWEFYMVPKVEGDEAQRTQGKSPLDTSTWNNAAGHTDQRWRPLDVLYVGYVDWSLVFSRRKSGA